MHLIMRIKVGGDTCATCEIQKDITPKEVIYRAKYMINNFNEKLSNIFKEKDNTIASFYILACENMKGTMYSIMPCLVQQSVDLLKKTYPNEWAIFGKKAKNTQDAGVFAINKETIKYHMWLAANGYSLITLDFDEKKIVTKDLYESMATKDVYKKLETGFIPNDFISLDNDINSFYFNELEDMFNMLKSKKGWYLKTNPYKINLCESL